jgi:hypothetical protein
MIRSSWCALSDEEIEEIINHLRTSDYPETVETWLGMARGQGYTRSRELFVDPSQTFAMFCFHA